MKYTPLQIREIVEISQETLRHWRRVLSPLKGRNGYAPCFTAGDALALKIVNEIVETLHVRVQMLQPIADELFNICCGINWPRLEQRSLVIRLADHSIQACEDSAILNDAEAGVVVVVTLKPHIDNLRSRLTESDGQYQYEMPFPPVGLKKTSIA
jgi:hypothetical protein